MKKTFASFIGFFVFMGSLHVMPAKAMDHGDTMTMDCISCTEDDHMDGDCFEAMESNHIGFHSQPSENDCDCHYDSHEGNHHVAVFQTASQFKKGKEIPVNQASLCSGERDDQQPFFGKPNSHAPPNAYMTAISSVRQLK